MSILRRRILSGVVFGLPTLLVVYLGGVPFFAAVFAAAIVAGHEYQQMVVRGGYRSFYVLQLGATAFLLLGAVWLSPEAILGGLSLILISSWAWQVGGRGEREHPFVDWALSLAGALYVGWLFINFVVLRGVPGGLSWVLLALFSTSICGSFAYLFGKVRGKHPFFPWISPRKTRECALAGWVGGTGAALLVGWMRVLSILQALTLGLAISLAPRLVI